MRSRRDQLFDFIHFISLDTETDHSVATFLIPKVLQLLDWAKASTLFSYTKASTRISTKLDSCLRAGLTVK